MKLWNNLTAFLRSGLCTITNLAVSDPQWIQASLSVSAGGLGIRRVVSLALPAFLASAASTHSLQSLLLLNCHCRLALDSNREMLMRNLDHHLQHEHTGLTK